MDKIYCIMGAVIILNIFLSRWYAHQGKLKDLIINACATSIIVSLMIILIKMG